MAEKLTPKLRFPQFSDNWDKNKLDEIVKLRSEKYNPKKENKNYTCIELENIEPNTGRLLGYTDLEGQKSSKNIFHKGDVLFGKLRPYLRKYYYAQGIGVCSSEVWVFKSKEGIHSNFLYRLVQTEDFIKHANVTTGSRMPRGDWSYLKNIKICLPGLAEQEKIASFFLLFDKKLNLQRKRIKALKTYKKGMMQKIFSHEIRFKDDDGRSFPDWEEKELNEVIREVEKTRVENPWELELLRVRLYTQGVERTGQYPNKTKRGRPYYRRYEGELLIGRQNMHNGGFGFVKKEHDGLICSNAISSYLPRGNNNMKYVYYRMSDRDYYRRIGALIGGTGQKEISRRELLKLKIDLPSPREQEKIADFLSLLDRKISLEKEKLETMEKLNKGFMQRMFI